MSKLRDAIDKWEATGTEQKAAAKVYNLAVKASHQADDKLVEALVSWCERNDVSPGSNPLIIVGKRAFRLRETSTDDPKAFELEEVMDVRFDKESDAT